MIEDAAVEVCIIGQLFKHFDGILRQMCNVMGIYNVISGVAKTQCSLAVILRVLKNGELDREDRW